MTFNHAPQPVGLGPAAGWEPALNQLRNLPPEPLERLLRSWLGKTGWHQVVAVSRHSGATTFHATGHRRALPPAIGVRIHQRRSRLQPHHIDAFAGYLLRAGLPAGLLISTGEVTESAAEAAVAHRTPYIRLRSGSEWAWELQEEHVGLRRHKLWRWTLTSSLFSESHPSRRTVRGER